MIYLIYYIGHHVVLTGAVLMAISAVAAVFLFRARKPLPAIAVIAVMLVLAFVNGFAGAGFANGLVYTQGQSGQAKTVGSENTYAKLNRRSGAWIYQYEVLITAPGGQVIRTRYRGYTRVLYPAFDYPVTSADYPSHIGDVFNVRYLPGHPDAFVIVTNDHSPWAAPHACKQVSGDLSRIKHKYDPDPTNPKFPPQYIAAIHAYLASGCATDPAEVATLRQTLTTLGDK
jgi:hypothetical protein